jgi:hypothetical protein
MAALELMQRDPKEAQKRFASDPDVNRFMQEFGKVMASHFQNYQPSSQTQPQQSQSSSSGAQPKMSPAITEVSGESKIQEVGPLQAAAIQRKKEQESQQGAKPSAVSSSSSSNEDKEAARVQEILADPELRELLMDPATQRMLQECGDPNMFRRHMMNPATAAKLKKLYQAGLVGTAM